MRLTIAAVLFLLPCSAFAQPPCAPIASTLSQFDPYNPSDLAIIRNYGGTLLAQAPLSELLKLDPNVPSQAALLRQLGGGIPLWGFPGYSPYLAPPPYLRAEHGPPCEPTRESRRRVRAAVARARPAAALDVRAVQTPIPTTVTELLAALEQRRSSAPATTAPARAQTPGRSSGGITFVHAGRAWISAGRAVPFSEADFIDVAGSTDSPVFRRRGGDDTVIYVPTTPGMVAPFRAVKQ